MHTSEPSALNAEVLRAQLSEPDVHVRRKHGPAVSAAPAPRLSPSSLSESVAAIVLAGGHREDKNHPNPLTDHRAAAALEIGGTHRLIDFALGNLVHSGVGKMFVLTQWHSHELLEHVAKSYSQRDMAPVRRQGFVDILCANQTTNSAEWSLGSADAVRKHLCSGAMDTPCSNEAPVEDYIVLSGEGLYRLDFAELIAEHRAKDADITIATVIRPGSEAHGSGVMDVGDNGRVKAWQEKPEDLECVRGFHSCCDPAEHEDIGAGIAHFLYSDDEHLYDEPCDILLDDKPFALSLGAYIFKREALIELLAEEGDLIPVNANHEKGEPTVSAALQFGRDVIPYAVRGGKRVFSHICSGLDTAGTPLFKDVRTLSDYYCANISLTNRWGPMKLLHDTKKPLVTRRRNLPPTTIRSGEVDCTLLSEGCKVGENAILNDSVIGARTIIGPSARIAETVIIGTEVYETEEEEEEAFAAAAAAAGADKTVARVPLGIGGGSVLIGCVVDKNARIGRWCHLENRASTMTAQHPTIAGLSIQDAIVVVHKGAIIPDGTVWYGDTRQSN